MIERESRNPFPFQGTMSIEGMHSGSQTAGKFAWPTVPREAIEKAWTYVEDFLRRFDSNGESTGQVLALRGPHGSGKTHTLRVLMDRVIGARSGIEPLGNPFQIYVRAEGPDFIKLYQEAVAAIPEELLRNLSLRFLGSIVGSKIPESEEKREGSKRVDLRKNLQLNPEIVFDIFEEYKVELGEADESQLNEVQRVAGGFKDFHRVLGYLLSKDLASAAYDWLLVRHVSPELMRQLGVAGPISSQLVARWAFQLVVTLFARSGFPLIVYIDQYEKLLVSDGVLHHQNVGLIHSLVEFTPRENAMLVLCGNDFVWELIPRDLRQRFASHVVEFPAIKYSEALELVRIYLLPNSQILESESKNEMDDIYPFTKEAVQELIKFSSGNIRRFLQLCSLVWNAATASGQEIEGRTVRAVVRKFERSKYFDESSVRREIETLLRRNNLTFDQEVGIGDHKVDFLIKSGTKRPILAIDIREAIFYWDEATKALESLDTRTTLAQKFPTLRYALVVLGYVSPEIVSRIRNIVDELIVFDLDTFEANIETVLQGLKEASQEPSLPVSDPQFERQIGEMRGALSKIAESRTLDIQVIESRISSLLERQGSDRLADRRQVAREAWAVERRGIEERIREVRKQRRSEDTKELERLCTLAHDRYRTRARLSGLSLMSIQIIASLTYGFQYFQWMDGTGFRSFNSSFVLQLLAISILFSIVIGVFLIWPEGFLSTIAPGKLHLRSVPGSIENLDAAARAYNDRQGNPEFGLFASFPQERYAAAISQKLVPNERVLEALSGEQSSVVRRALARTLGRARHSQDVLGRLREYVLNPSIASEFGYAVEGLARAGVEISDYVRELPPRLRALAALCGVPVASSRTDSLALELAVGLSPTPSTPRQKALADAFERGPDRVNWGSGELVVGQAQIDVASAELSPFDPTGLGSLDELASIQRIDQMYLFFRHLSFLFERDLLLSPDPKS